MGEVGGAAATAMTGEAGADLEAMLLVIFLCVIYMKLEYEYIMTKSKGLGLYITSTIANIFGALSGVFGPVFDQRPCDRRYSGEYCLHCRDLLFCYIGKG